MNYEDGEIHPAFVVVPGGGYRMVSVTEGELVAKKFYDKGFNTFVITYTTCMPGPEPVRLQPLKDLSKAIVYMRKNKEAYGIDEHRVTVCGFSAGAHLCGTLADEDWANGNFGGMYCMKQMTDYISYCIENGLTPVEPFSGLGALPKGTDVAASDVRAHFHGKRP